MTLKHICIYGAGAIGGWIGARLAQLPHVHVGVVARGATLQALQQDGLRLRANPRDALPDVHAHVHASANPDTLGVQDVVIVAVKAPSLPDVAKHMAPLLGPHTIVLTAMNGVPWWFLHQFGGAYANTALSSVDPQGHIAQAIAPHHVVGGVVHASCSVTAPGLIQHHFGNGLIVGEPAGGVSERVQALQNLLTQAGFDVTVSPQIQKDVWYKLWGNMSMNPVSALTGATTDKILDDPLVLELISQVMLEAKAIGAQLGLPIAQQPQDRHAVTRQLGAFKTSMLQDVQAHRPVELDALVSAVRELGLLTQVKTPFTDALLGLARLQAQTLGLYPTP